MPILEWLGKNEAVKSADKVPYKLLKVNEELSYGDKTENMIIKGDNLEALKALLPYYKGQVKCIYIDPPYNTGSAFEYYDDNLEHSQWLSLMYPRLELLRELLTEDGTIWIQIDDDEFHYLKVICDEVFGRVNFINTISVNMKNIAGASGGGEDKRIKKNVEFILVYAKNYRTINSFKPVYKYSPIYKLVEEYRDEGKSWKYTSALTNEGDKIYIGSTVDGDGNEIKIFERLNYEIKSIGSIIRDENISEKATVLTTLLGSDKVHPKLAFEHSGLFTDPDVAYKMSEDYYNEVLEREQQELSSYVENANAQSKLEVDVNDENAI